MKNFLLYVIVSLLALLFCLEGVTLPKGGRTMQGSYSSTHQVPSAARAVGSDFLPPEEPDSAAGSPVKAAWRSPAASPGETAAVPTVSWRRNIGRALFEVSVAGLGKEAEESSLPPLTGIDSSAVRPLDMGMVNVTEGRGAYRLQLPSGGAEADVRVELPYDTALLPAGYGPRDIETYCYDGAHRVWTAIAKDTTDEGTMVVVSELHLGREWLEAAENGGGDGSEGPKSPGLEFINAVMRTPEMPETSAIAPTSLKELKAADPLEGVVMIQPPVAGNDGGASLSYPLEIPSGRQGMQPDLSLTYSSGGGNGVVGVGWDMPVPEIAVETRWGVPRYDPYYESEVYLLGGEQLLSKDASGRFDIMPHRTNRWVERKNGEVQFYPRRGEAFDSIVRHGTSPDNYWWSVTDRNGTTSYYGKRHDADTLDTTAVLQELSGMPIGKWKLTERVDVNGNRVLYSYERTDYTDGTNLGVEILLRDIFYTDKSGDSSSSPPYWIEFSYKSRTDKQLSVNTGVPENLSHVLDRISVRYLTYKDPPYTFYGDVRTYLLEYSCDGRSFYKSRLERILNNLCYIDCNGRKACQRDTLAQFSYFDAPDVLFGQPVTINLAGDGVQSTFLTSGFESHGEATALGATRGHSWSLGGSATVGLGPIVCLTSASVGGNFDYSRSRSSGALTLIDLDGDGAADKVFKKGNKVYYRKRINDSDEQFHYGDSMPIAGVDEFLSEVGNSITWGLQASAGCSFSGSWPTSTSNTTTYFADVNADGLPDLITEEGVKFNVTQKGGRVAFSPFYGAIREQNEAAGVDMDYVKTDSSACGGGIIFDGEVDPNIACSFYRRIDTVIIDSSREELNRKVAAFRAAHAGGTVSYECMRKTIVKCDTPIYCAFIYKVEFRCTPPPADPDLETVKIWVAPRSGRLTLHSSIRLLADTSRSRRQSRNYDGIQYRIEWHKNISYGRTSSKTGRPVMGLKETGNTTLKHKYLYTAGNANDNFSQTLDVQAGDLFFFRLQSGESRHFDRVRWNQEMTYAGYNGDPSGNPDEYGVNRDYYNAREDFIVSDSSHITFYEDGLDSALVEIAVRTGGMMTSGFTMLEMRHNGNIVWIPLENDMDEVICRRVAAIKDNTLSFAVIASGTVDWSKIDIRAHVEYCIAHPEVSGRRDTLHYYPPVYLDIYNYRDTPEDDLEHKLFGPLYRGWGQFAYNSESYWSPISPGHLVSPADTYTAAADTAAIRTDLRGDVGIFHSQEATSKLFDEHNMYNPLSQETSWVPMNADPQHRAWVGYGNINYMKEDTLSNSRLPEMAGMDEEVADIPEYDHPVPVAEEGQQVKTIRKQSRSELNNYSISAAVAIISTGYSTSTGENKVTTDYMDMNGDRYPDFVGESRIQHSMPWGGIGYSLTYLPKESVYLTRSTTSSSGMNFGASYPLPTRGLSNNPSKARISIDGSGSLSCNLGDGGDWTTNTWTDINGDGLPDKVNAGSVAFSKGYSFTEPIPTACTLREGESHNSSLNFGASFNIAQASISGGVGVNESENYTRTMLADVNGDGLQDIVTPNGFVRYQTSFNTWQHHRDARYHNFNGVSEGRSYSESLNLGVTMGFTAMALFKICAGLSTSPINRTFSKDRVQLVDVNGDGFADHVTSDSETQMQVRYNRAAKTNLLKTVTQPTGATIELDYDMPLSCYEKPHRSWNLAKVEVIGHCDSIGGNRSKTAFDYRNPHYDRYERMDYGYDTVISRQYDTDGGADALYRYTVTGYENRDFARRGRKLSETLYWPDGHKCTETLYQYRYRDLASKDTNIAPCAIYAPVYVDKEAVIHRYYEHGCATPKITAMEVRVYDSVRNVTEFENYGNVDGDAEYFKVHVSYKGGMPHNLISLPDTMTVLDTENNVLRKSVAAYDSLGRTTHIGKYIDAAGLAQACFDMTYDDYGNVRTILYPHNGNSDTERVAMEYTYDTTAHIWPEVVRNLSLGYRSTAEYSRRWGKPLKTTDINGNQMTYIYDPWGRLTSVTGPYEQGKATATIRMAYYPNRFGVVNPDRLSDPEVSYAVTEHYDPQHPDNPIRTTLFRDDLGRLVQTKKDAWIDNAEVSVVSGKVMYDCFGRTVEKRTPFIESLDKYKKPNYHASPDTVTTTGYDILDRVTKVVLPTGDSTITEHLFEGLPGSNGLFFKTYTTDALGNHTSQYTDCKGDVRAVKAGSQATTTFLHSPLGELLQSTDPSGHTTTYTHDLLGRTLSRTHPDAGTDTYTYDPAGNLLAHATQILAGEGLEVQYYYHYNRPDSVVYPLNPANNVRYTYGTAADSCNCIGKVRMVEDASGFKTFSYGKMGEVVEENHTFVLPGEQSPYTFRMKYAYDSWNRLQSMTYPDGEEVEYSYDPGGMLTKITGWFEEEATNLPVHPQNRGWGEGIVIDDPDPSVPITTYRYAYPYVDSIAYNRFGLKTMQLNGNGTRSTYRYDILQRMDGLGCAHPDGRIMQSLSYRYDAVGNITRMDNAATVPIIFPYSFNISTTSSWSYRYDSLYRMTGATLSFYPLDLLKASVQMIYHADGRIASKSQDYRTFIQGEPDFHNDNWNYVYGDGQPHAPVSIGEQTLTWDANGNLLTDNGATLGWDEENRLTTYGKGTVRAFYRYDAQGERFYKNTGSTAAYGNPTLYASPYLVAAGNEYTKHYYIEDERFACRIGDGAFPDIDSAVVSNALLSAKQLEVNDAALDSIVPNQFDFLRTRQGQWSSQHTTYWQHSDHLGSASWITDTAGRAIQHLQYMPWGEPLLDYRNSSFNTRYTFSGKERDEETGYSYFGARYYNSTYSIWLSVDPMSDKYPHQSNYTFCSNNPIKVIDPNGMNEWDLARNGELRKRENGRTDIDVVYATNENGEIVSRNYKANTINHNKKSFSSILNKGDKYETSYTTDYMSFENRETATDFFEFAAENTDVEWGFNSTDCHSYVGTSHKNGFNSIPLPKGNNLIQIHSHSNPSNRLSSGFEGSDVDMMYKNPGTFKVYEAFNKSYISIDPTNLSIKRELSHNLLKSFSILKRIIPL